MSRHAESEVETYSNRYSSKYSLIKNLIPWKNPVGEKHHGIRKRALTQVKQTDEQMR